MSVSELLTLRFLIATVVLWLGVAVFYPKAVRLPGRQILLSLALGAIGYVSFSTLYFTAISGLSLALAAMLLFTFPFFVLLGEWLLHRLGPNLGSSQLVLGNSPTRHQWMAFIVAIAGLLLLVGSDWQVERWWALAAGLGSGASYGLYVLVSGVTQRKTPALSSTLYVITGAAVCFLSWHQVPIERMAELLQSSPGPLFGIAIVCTVLPIGLFLLGLQEMSSSKASLLVMIEPLVAAMLGWLVFAEKLNLEQIAGASLIFIAIALTLRRVPSTQ